MRPVIYYVFNTPFLPGANGVTRKINSKILWLNKLGCDVTLLIVQNMSRDYVPVALPYKTASLYYDTRSITGLFRSQKARAKYFNALSEYFRKVNLENAFVFMRYNNASREMFEFVSEFEGKVVLEHNTKELDELRLNIVNNKAQLPWYKVGTWLSHYEYNYLPLKNERSWASKVFRKIFGGVCVTKEIEEYEKLRCAEYNTCTISNSVDADFLQCRTNMKYDPERLELFMLSGARAHWHGVDRIIRSLKAYKGETIISVYFYGDYYEEVIDLAKKEGLYGKTVFFEKAIDPKSGLLNRHHMALGTVAIHRVGLTELASLKIRESFAAGFPVVFAGKDTDMSYSEELKEFCFELNSDEELIDMQRLVDFYKRVYSINDFSARISFLAEKYISTETKMKQLMNFLAKKTAA